VQAERRTK